jgi:hypothetical protein
VAFTDPQLALGRRGLCVVGRDFQSQPGRAFPGGCNGRFFSSLVVLLVYVAIQKLMRFVEVRFRRVN